ncbi:hypothetical protein [Agromyces bracchium]|uniref:Uncharacterized protein n=1 Tax=Agromyces bracchium TaxID=88376 RepID=A0A6I3MA27_9MICO|nr:hypothetical protein [Agromyces bracchium]MTH70329.1 hypothetical protein [Agromyces bracchium]
MKPGTRGLVLGAGMAAVGIGLVFAALFSHSSRVFALDHLAGTEHHDLMVELSAATPTERWLLTLGALILACGLLVLALGWIRQLALNRKTAGERSGAR